MNKVLLLRWLHLVIKSAFFLLGAVERQDCEICNKLQGVFDSHGELAYVELHKNCYYSYTSKDDIKNPVSSPFLADVNFE